VNEDARAAILAMVERETDAWNRQDASALVQLFHPDMVWPWPPSEDAHDPMSWIMPMGRFDAERWRASWQSLFDTHELVSNERVIRRIEATSEGDGGLAVVDIDTRWRNVESGEEQIWKGRACKVYALCAHGWKITMHTGLLAYEE